jgi:probable phosphoglycerate mutase
MLDLVVLIRHGETSWTLTGQHTGRTDLPLTPNGRLQAAGLHRSLAGLRIEHIFTSPLQRARETCELAGLAIRPTINPDLDEWDYGDYESLKTAEICVRRPGWNVFEDGCPGGESVEQVSSRADQVLDGLRRLNGNIALFSHGQFLRVVASRWIGRSAAEGQHLALDTASISILGFEHHNGRVPALCLWNGASNTAKALAAPQIDEQPSAPAGGLPESLSAKMTG